MNARLQSLTVITTTQIREDTYYLRLLFNGIATRLYKARVRRWEIGYVDVCVCVCLTSLAVTGSVQVAKGSQQPTFTIRPTVLYTGADEHLWDH